MDAPRWEHFDHGSDIGVRGIGRSRAEAFEQAALALTAVVTDPAAVRAAQRTEVDCRADDDELLLVEWLSALVYEMATGGLLFARYEVELTGRALHGSAWGEPVDRQRHLPAVEVKGVTLTGLKVEQRADGLWVAQCVVDV